ncbi:MAG: hypothetical protein ACLRFE_02040, partial [Clostridia bacterium]
IDITKLDGKVQIKIKATPKTNNHYDILIRKGNICEFDKNTYGSESCGAKVYFNEDKQHRLHWHIDMQSDNEQAEYTIVFDNTQWVKQNIKDITSQLLNREKQIIANHALKIQVKNVNNAVINNNHASLIKQMIIDNTDSLTLEDVSQIEQVLDTIKQSLSSINSQSTQSVVQDDIRQDEKMYVKLNHPSNSRSRYWSIYAEQVNDCKGYKIKIGNKTNLDKLYSGNLRPRYKVSRGYASVTWDKRNEAYLIINFDKFNFESKVPFCRIDILALTEQDELLAKDIYAQLNEQVLQLQQSNEYT